MASQQENTSSNTGNQFTKGLQKDLNDSAIPQGAWVHSRNATPVSSTGDLTTLGNEPSNLQCLFQAVPYTVIGVVYIIDSSWVIFSTDNTNSEIGIFNDDTCTYTPYLTPQYNSALGISQTNTSCLNFNTDNLISGVCKQQFDCSYQVYFADGNNPDRTLNLTVPPYICVNTTIPDPNQNPDTCYICVPVTNDGITPADGTPAKPFVLDCDKLRLASLMTVPCLNVEIGTSGGNLFNGSYFVVMAYVLNGQVVTDYFLPSNTQPIFSHQNESGSLLVNVNTIDRTYFSEFQLVLVSVINQQAVATDMGIFSTQSSVIHIDIIDNTRPKVPIELIPVITPEYEKSEAMYPIANYLIRVAPTTNFDFNYQPLANGIVLKWVSVEYPADYYKKGGNNTSYLRDEVYAFFIRWIYNTGVKSSSYHIPGRPSMPSDLVASNLHDRLSPTETQLWQTNNTAYIDNVEPLNILPDGGVEVGCGYMGYWQSTDIYPDDKPSVWNASGQSWPANTPGQPVIDLCGQPIRHHKMPDQSLTNITPQSHGVPVCNHFRVDNTGAAFYRFLGIRVENVRPPLYNDGTPITNIVAYELLRGTREGNKTVIAKGMLNNMREYALTPGTSTRQGLYQNYPYNSLSADPTLTTIDVNNLTQNPHGYNGLTELIQLGNPATQYSKSVFTFHSPDTQFKNPFLSTPELKLYGEISGIVTGNFSPVPLHPKEKLMGDTAFIVAALLGLGAASLAIGGKKTTVINQPRDNTTGSNNLGLDIAYQVYNTGILETYYASIAGIEAIPGTSTSSLLNILSAAFFGNNLSLTNDLEYNPLNPLSALSIVNTAGVGSPGFTAGYTSTTSDWGATDYQGPLVRAFSGIITFAHYWSLGTDAAMNLIEAIVPYQQYAYQYRSHGWYSNFARGNVAPGNTRKLIQNANYLENQLQDFGSQYKINNLYRGRAVAIDIGPNTITNPSGGDNTINSISTAVANHGLSNATPASTTNNFNTQTTSYYGALKVELENQYSQMGSLREIPISCSFPSTPTALVLPNTDVTFGGDTYVSRYTEKNTFFYFYDWLYNQPDGYEFDYTLRYMVNFPTFWANFTKYDFSSFLQGVWSAITTLNFPAILQGLPSAQASLDNGQLGSGQNSASSFTGILKGLINNVFLTLELKNAYFYLFQSGVRDFYVESEVNTDLRDWGDLDAERFYDPYSYTDLPALFDPKIIKSGNFFKYDYSLSVGKMFTNFISWGSQQNFNIYDPAIAYSCYRYFPKKLIFSLPQNMEQTKDYWRSFLPNNYYNFKSKVSAIKDINKSGAMIFFETDSPVMFQGTDQLQTALGTKLTIGDGGLFSQPQQSIINTEEALEYGSCQNRLSVINTPMGIFWMSENQGKIFNYAGGINDIGYMGVKFWLKKYLPYVLTNDFPNYPLTDNPVAGIGCQAVYDNQIEIIYFSKRDFMLLPLYQGTGRVVYYPLGSLNSNGTLSPFQDVFVLDGVTPYELGDPTLFQDASWTISYDPKEKQWLSFHDWHPSLIVPGKNYFVTIVNQPVNYLGVTEPRSTFWKHNVRVDSFCNFYGIDFPFELEYVAATGITVNTLRSIEYYLEVYKYDTNGYNKFHFLDANFDQAIIYNTEQVSGVLQLNDTPKNNAYGTLGYPIINANSIAILYDKVEQKYRFQTFWDITDDRGEFDNAERYIWLWDSNGYTRTLNPNNLNYQKQAFQRKKFRHYLVKCVLQKLVSGNMKFITKVIVNKNLLSKR